MKLIKLNGEVKFESPEGGYKLTLEQGVSYIVPEYLADNIKSANVQGVISKYSDLYSVYERFKGQPLGNRTLIVFREGGIGDLIFVVAILKKIKELNPDAKICLCCNGKMHSLFVGLPFITEVFHNPMNVSIAETALGMSLNKGNTCACSIEMLIEHSQEAKTTYVYDLIADAFGVKRFKYEPTIFLDKEEVDRVSKKYFPAPLGHINMALQTSASAPLRTLKPQYTIKFLNDWALPDTRFFILDSPNRVVWVKDLLRYVSNKNIKIINLCTEDATLQRTAAIISLVDFVIAPDSSMIHVAAALNIPMLGLYGAFPSDLRMNTYKNAYAINAMPDNCEYAEGEYKACFKHAHICSLAEKYNRVYPPCMDLIQPKYILAGVYGALKELEIISEVP